MSELVVPTWAWGLLAGLMVILITIDLLAHRGDRVDSRRSALVWSIGWILAAVAFGGFVGEGGFRPEIGHLERVLER